VHDVGNHYVKMPENAVITNEPGIYIWDENLGIRIENDLVVKSNGVIRFIREMPDRNRRNRRSNELKP
jgi:Xaa-Pro aminopeptidase